MQLCSWQGGWTFSILVGATKNYLERSILCHGNNHQEHQIDPYLVALLVQYNYGIVATSMKSSITTWPRAGPTGTLQEGDFCGIQQGSHCWITSGIKSIHIEQCIIWTQCILGNLQNTNNAKFDNFRAQGFFSPAPPGNGRTTCQFPVFSWFKGQWALAFLHKTSANA